MKHFCRIYYHIVNRINLSRYHIKYGDNLVLNGKLWIYGNPNITFGDNCRVNSGKNFNVIGGDTRSSFVCQKNGRIEIENHVGISNSTLVAFSSIFIEDDVLIGGGCKIYDSDFHSLEFENRMQQPDRHIKVQPVYIKEGAFIGAQSIILKGVTIGKRSVVGAGSVVTKSIPDGEVWGGNPARFIRKV